MMSEEIKPAEGAPVEPQGEPVETTDWKAEARKWETRAKADRGAAEKLQQLEEEQKTAEQKTADRLAAAEKRAAELEVKANRAEVAAAKNVPAALLTGSTVEELEAAADALIAFRGVPAPVQENLSVSTIGQTPAPVNVTLDDQIKAAEAAGDRPQVIALKAMKLGTTN